MNVRESLRRIGVPSAAAALAFGLAGCSSSSPSVGSNGNTPANGGGGNVKFAIQFNFSGTDSIQGSFTDVESGSGYSSCAEFASGDSVGFVQGPATQLQPGTQIEGKFITFSFLISKDRFHGPATYTGGVLVGGGVTVGNDTFLGTTSTVTLNSDGSGNGSFSNLAGLGGGSESGTVTWTCSN